MIFVSDESPGCKADSWGMMRQLEAPLQKQRGFQSQNGKRPMGEPSVS